MHRQQIMPDWPWASKFRIAQGVRVGNTIYVSGQVAYDRNGNLVGNGDMKTQAEQTFRNVEEVLQAAGGTMRDVVKITAWLTDMDRYAEYAEARAAAFPDLPPASASVSSPRLVNPDLLVEIEAVAVLHQD